MEETLEELVGFLQPAQRLDLKTVAVGHVLGLTGSKEGKDAILDCPSIVNALLTLTRDNNRAIAKDAVLSMINLSADGGATKVFHIAGSTKPAFNIVEEAVKNITDENAELADPWAMVLSNLTRHENVVDGVLEELLKDDSTIPHLVKVFSNPNFNKKKSRLHYLAPIFCNLTQTRRGREVFCESTNAVLDRVLSFTSYEESLLRRGGAIGVLKNILFDSTYHDMVLDEDAGVLQLILYPLCGPENFTDEENDKFPMELQFLPETKSREEDPDLRQMLLDSLLQLCATKKYREHLRSKGVYEILREYHKWEAGVGRDKACLLACENVVDILIKKELEIGVDNYKDVEVPDNIVDKFIQEDAEYLKEPL